MARKTKDISIGPLKVRITQMSSEDAPLGLARAGRLFGAMLTNAGDELRMAASLFQSFDDADFSWLRAKFLENSKLVVVLEQSNGATQEHTPPLRLESFDGNLHAQMTWIAESAKWNYADFLGDMMSSSRPLAGKTPSDSSSTNPSAGGSGAPSPTPGSAPA